MAYRKKRMLILAAVAAAFVLAASGWTLATGDSDYVVENGVLIRYDGIISNVLVIPDDLGITAIGEDFLWNKPGLNRIVIPSGVTRIGQNAIRECYNLKEIVLPDTLEEIGAYAFAENDNLKTINLPDSILEIGEGAFYGDNRLEAISLPSGLTRISESLFTSCSALQTVNIPDTVTDIASEAFKYCSGLSLTVPASVTYIEDADAIGCKEIRVCDGSYAMTFCQRNQLDYRVVGAMGSARMEGGVTAVAIGEQGTLKAGTEPEARFLYAYYPDGTLLGKWEANEENASSGIYNDGTEDRTWLYWTVTFCPEKMGTWILVRSSVRDDGGTSQYARVDVSFEQDSFVVSDDGRLLKYTGAATELVIPDDLGIVNLGSALKGNRTIRILTLPSTLTAVNSDDFSGFYYLQLVRYPDGANYAGSINFSKKCPIGGIMSAESELSPTTKLESNRPVSFTAETDGAAAYLMMYDDGGEKIAQWAAEGNSEMSGVMRVWHVSYQFPTYPQMTSASASSRAYTFKANVSEQEPSEGKDAYVYVKYIIVDGELKTSIPGSNVVIPNGLGIRTLKGSLYSFRTALQTIQLPEGLEEIGNNAFIGCENLTEVTLPSTLKKIESGVFESCTGLTAIELPDGLTEIGSTAFRSCPATLTVGCGSWARTWAEEKGREIVLRHQWSESAYVWNDSWTEVTASRICACETLKETETVAVTRIVVSPTEETAGSAVYTTGKFEPGDCEVQSRTVMLPALKELKVLRLPEQISRIGEEAFFGLDCEAVIIPEECEEIGPKAFAGCERLVYVRLPESGISIADDAFDERPELILDFVPTDSSSQETAAR